MSSYLNLRSSAATDPIRNFRFLVTFTPVGGSGVPNFQDGDFSVGFISIAGLSAQTNAIPYREGGYNTTMHYLPGQQQFSPVTFQRGVVLGSNIGWEWFSKLYDPGTTAEQPTGDFRYQVDIKVLKYPAPNNRVLNQNASNINVAAQFTLLNAWPTNLAYSDLNAADDAVVLEQLVLVHEGLLPKISGNTPRQIDANGVITPGT